MTWIVSVVVGKYSESVERNFLFDCFYIVRTRRTAILTLFVYHACQTFPEIATTNDKIICLNVL
jgi:hypothetical protein